jgi:hypothetical protein
MDWFKSARTVTLTGLAFTATIPMAGAFFPPVPQPGEVVTVVPPSPPPPIVVPPVDPVPPVCVSPNVPLQDDCGCSDPGRPQSVPEPATIIATATGLATLAGWGLRKKK